MGWWDDNAVYLTPERLKEAAGGTLKEELIASALNDAGMIHKTKGGRHLYVSWVPSCGRMKAYALSRDHFGRGQDEGSIRTVAGGRL